MKKVKMILSLFLLISLFLVGLVSASLDGGAFVLVDTETINATATYTSSAIDLNAAEYLGVWYKATSAGGTPDVKIEFQMSYDDTAGNFVEPEGASDIETNLTTETAHVKRLSCPPMRYLRIKVTGNAANPADTIVTVIVFNQRLFTR